MRRVATSSRGGYCFPLNGGAARLLEFKRAGMRLLDSDVIEIRLRPFSITSPNGDT